MRYATVTISALNGGTGKVYRNLDQWEFEATWKQHFAAFPVPTHGVGGVGNGILGFSYKIYERPSDTTPGLESRLFRYKFGKWVKVANEVSAAAKDLKRRGLEGKAGDPLPNLMSGEAVDWIHSHQTEFRNLIAGKPFDW
jgi:hypothetical protein